MPETPALNKPREKAADQPGIRFSKLALFSFILTLIPFAYIPVLGFFLGILAWVRITWKPRQLKGKGWAIAAAVIGFCWWVFLVTSVFLTSAFNRVTMPQDQARQLEAKTSMRTLWEAEATYVHQNLSFSDDPAAMGWQPEGDWIYTYHIGKTIFPPKIGQSQGLPDKVTTYVTAETFLIVAVANLDLDPDLDVWTLDYSGETRHIMDDLNK